MTIHVTQTRRQMIGSALGVIGAGIVGVSVKAGGLTAALSGIETTADGSGASATERASRVAIDTPSTVPDDTADDPDTVPPGPSVRTLTFPVDVTGGKLAIPNGFGGNSVTRGSGRHNGVDIGNGSNCGTGRGRPLLACTDGVYVDTSYGSSYGRKITLSDQQGNYFHYHHMDLVAEGLELGDAVRRGQVVGFMGSSGDTRWAHLHFEVWVGGLSPQRGGMAVDPVPWLPLPIEGVTVGSLRCD